MIRSRGPDTTTRILLSAGLLATMALAGCPDEGPTDTTCATILVESTSTDPPPNITFTAAEANQCDVAFDAQGTLTIDMLDRSTGNTNPRVLLTLREVGSEIPLNTQITLSRTDNQQLSPAIYQEFDNTTMQGPFWSSLRLGNAGVVTFTALENGDVQGTFSFNADNPVALNNAAEGGIFVSGTVTIAAADAAAQ